MRVCRKIFINYRSSDAGDAAALLDNVLSLTFGAECMLKASREIRAGEHYPSSLMAGLREMCVMLTLVGRNWLVPSVHSPDDWIRCEIAYALRVDPAIPVIPVLLGGVASVPPAPEPAADFQPLTLRQTVHLRARHVHQDIPCPQAAGAGGAAVAAHDVPFRSRSQPSNSVATMRSSCTPVAASEASQTIGGPISRARGTRCPARACRAAASPSRSRRPAAAG